MVDGRKSSSYCSTITVVAFVALCLVGVAPVVVMPATSGAAPVETILSSLRGSFILRTIESLVTSYLSSHQPNQTHHYHYHNHHETHHHYHQCPTPSQNTNHNNQHTHLAPPTSPQPPSTPSPQPPSPPSPSCPQPPQPPAHPLAPPIPISFFRVVFWWWPSALLPLPCPLGPQAFRLRGIWPTGNDGESITNCDSGETYVEEIPKSIPNIETCWTGAASTNRQLWKNEWVKHGSCSGLTVEEYFRMGMRACSRFSNLLLDALVHRGVSLGMSGTRVFYLSSFKADLMEWPEISCITAFQSSHLYQVIMCVDVQHKLISCPLGKRFGKCIEDTPIYLAA